MAVTPWLAGMRMTSSRLNAITPIYTSWTPTWSTTTGSNIPSIGNGTYNCDFTRTGNRVEARFEVIFGSTTTFGSTDNWIWSLPVTAAATSDIAGYADVTYTSTTTRYVGRVRLFSTSTFEIDIVSGRPSGVAISNGGIIDGASPETMTSGTAVRALVIYEAA
ncbi:hypothetical protein PV350_23470 [Streptomyces sp. PA03-6a]|nr:hypothetical protein [Streptomyces sp. PA03-6a]